MNDRDILVLKKAIEHYQPCTKESLITEIKNWSGGNPEEAFDHAVKNGYIKKQGKNWFNVDLWVLDTDNNG